MKGTLGEGYLDLGRLYQAKFQKDRARECFASAVSLFDECGLESYLKQTQQALDSLG